VFYIRFAAGDIQALGNVWLGIRLGERWGAEIGKMMEADGV
jgi:hypothetical protein